MLGAANSPYVDAIEQHRKLGCVNLHGPTIGGNFRRAEPAPLEPLIVQHQSAAIPEQDFAAVATPAKEHEEVTVEQIHTPLALNDSAQPIVTPPQIHRLDRQVDSDASW